MPSWTNEQLREFENRRAASHTEPQRPVCHGAVGPVSGTDENRARFSIRVTSYRVRLIDPDNMVGKYFLDCLKYSGLIPDDTARDVDYVIQQKKVETKADERTEIEVSVIV